MSRHQHTAESRVKAALERACMSLRQHDSHQPQMSGQINLTTVGAAGHCAGHTLRRAPALRPPQCGLRFEPVRDRNTSTVKLSNQGWGRTSTSLVGGSSLSCSNSGNGSSCAGPGWPPLASAIPEGSPRKRSTHCCLTRNLLFYLLRWVECSCRVHLVSVEPRIY